MRNPFPFILSLSFLSLLPRTSLAEIIYLCDCAWTPPYSISSFQDNIYLNIFPGIVYYANAPSGNQAPAPENIAVASPNLGPLIWGEATAPASHQGFFFQTGQIFTVGPLSGSGSVGQVAGKAMNGGGSWTCRKDNNQLLFTNGAMNCYKNFYCQPVSISALCLLVGMTK